MSYLLDTGVLLRLINKQDALHLDVTSAVAALADRGEKFFATTQNVAELWNVSTRPVELNGLGLLVTDVLRCVELEVETTCVILREHLRHFVEFKRLGATYQIQGEQVHDARLVAAMLTWSLDAILTLNAQHFRRYEPEGIRVVTPQEVLSTEQQP
jgi:predicted nucleic acid-binding protein